MKTQWRGILLISIIVISFVLMMNIQPISQDLSYHDFADSRQFSGVPNLLNVISNVPFLLFGIMGIFYCKRIREVEAYWSWLTLFSGVTLVTVGSGYYHLNPGNETLVWDRLPIAIAFMGLYIAVLSEFVNPKIQRQFLVPSILLGFLSVLIWHLTDDLRFYLWVQFFPILSMPIVLVLYKGRYTHVRFLLYALIFYLFAKMFEFYDREIFSFLSEQLSGHTLKHIFASLSILSLYLMLQKRETIQH